MFFDEINDITVISNLKLLFFIFFGDFQINSKVKTFYFSEMCWGKMSAL